MARRTAAEIIEILKQHEEAFGENYLSIIEDVADSIEAPAEPDYSGYVKKEEYDALKQKYVDRFTMKPEVKEEIEKAQPVVQEQPVTYESLFTAE